MRGHSRYETRRDRDGLFSEPGGDLRICLFVGGRRVPALCRPVQCRPTETIGWRERRKEDMLLYIA